MSIIVKTFELTPASSGASFMVDGARTVAEAVGMLRLSVRAGVMVLVNGRLGGWDAALHDGDVVELLPAVGGG